MSAGASCEIRGRLLGRAATIALAAVLVGAGHSVLAPVKLRMDRTAPLSADPPRPAPGPQTPTQPTPAGGIGPPPGITQPAGPLTPPGIDLTIEQAAALHAQGVKFIDAREKADFEEGHIPGAWNITSDQVMGRAPDLVPFRDEQVVVYCGGGDCDASENVAKVLQQLGFTRIHIVQDGFPAWKLASKPVMTGPL